jgi:putative NADH-flavin reductase
MNLTVLGATGATGRELTRQALQRGHAVTAIARDPARITVADHGRLTRVTADVRDPESMTRALAGSTIVLSGLGVAHGEKPGVLSAGARAVADARPRRIIWIGAYGTGTSAAAAGALTRTLLRTFMRAELADKVTADTTVLTAGGTVFHCGPLSDGPLSPARRTVTLENAPRRIFPARVSRATVAAAMLDEAESGQHLGQTVVPLNR